MVTLNAQNAIIKPNVARECPKMGKVGFYSGTFDPVHVGHIEFALEAAGQFGLKKVLLLPEHTPHVKTDITDLLERVKMLELATSDLTKLKVVTLPTKRFTVHETLPLLQAMCPQDRLVFLCGSDVVKTFLYRWEGLKELLQTTDVVVGLRDNDTYTQIKAVFEELEQQESIKITFNIIKSTKHYLSSTSVRSGSHTISDVDPKVAEFIIKNKLYS